MGIGTSFRNNKMHIIFDHQFLPCRSSHEHRAQDADGISLYTVQKVQTYCFPAKGYIIRHALHTLLSLQISSESMYNSRICNPECFNDLFYFLRMSSTLIAKKITESPTLSRSWVSHSKEP